jgi:hypothetical protein
VLDPNIHSGTCVPSPGTARDTKPLVAGQKGLKLDDILRKLALVAREVAAQSARDDPVRTGRAPEAEIDTTGEQRFERAELLGDHHRRVIGQHDPARADADRRSRLSDMRKHDRRRRARNPRHPVMFGNPVAFIAQRLGVPRQIGGVRQRLRDGDGVSDGHKVEEREFRHETDMRSRPLRFNHRTEQF